MDSLEVENFRSLKHLKLEKLARVNLLVGKNNSGKTTALEAIYTLSTIELSSWPVIFDRNLNEERTDLRYFFYNFDDSQRIKLKADYAPQKEDENLQFSSWRAEIFTKESRQRKMSRQSGINTVYINLYISPRTTPYPFALTIVPQNASQEQDAFIEPLTKSAEKISEGGVDFPAYSRTLVRIVSTKDGVSRLNLELEEIKIAKREQEIISVLQLTDPRISSLDIVGDEVYLDLGSQFKMLMPVNLMGDGIQRLLLITILIAQRSGGVLLIDEVDNGLHYSALRTLWKGIVEAARKYDVQVFATTHSAEALRHLTWVLDSEKYKDYRDDVAAYTLIRTKEDEVRSFRYNYEQLEFAMENDIEVRN